MHLVHNERTKLTANWCNTIATAFLGAGAFVPIAASIYGLSALVIEIGALVALSASCIVISAVIHLIGRSLLGSLRE